MKRCKKQISQRFVSLFMAMALLLSGTVLPAQAYGDGIFAGTAAAQQEKVITSAEEFPKNITAEEVYVLGADIVLSEGQQITELAGVLDGKGYTITLADKPLADQVSGTIQNLGVFGSRVIENGTTTFASMATELTGVIQNCYATVSLHAIGFIIAGGIAGNVKGGTIQNSYMAGSLDGMFVGGLMGLDIGEEEDDYPSIKNSCYVNGEYVDAYGEFEAENCEKVTLDELKAGDFIDLLNTDIADTGFAWAIPEDGSNDGLPILIATDAPGEEVHKESLLEMIEAAQGLEEADYTAASWDTLQTVLEAAIAVYEDENATQEEVDAKTTALENAIDTLEENTEGGMGPAAPPEDESRIITITSQEDWENVDLTDSEAYYVLENDITIDGGYYTFDEFQGVLDGNGHTITFANAGWGLANAVGSDGILQNIYFTGTFVGERPVAPAGMDLKGKVINCYSDVSGRKASGLATNLSGGSLINCYSISDGAYGTLVKQYNAGKLIHTYWQEDLDNPAEFPEGALTESEAKTEAQMKTKEFVQLLNANRGEYGSVWGQNHDGYPYFGEDVESEDPEVPSGKYKVRYTPKGSTEAMVLEDDTLTISLDEVGSGGVAGKFALQDLPKRTEIEWNVRDVKPAEAMLIALEKAELYIYKEGTGLVTATEIKADGSRELVAAVKVEIKSYELQDIKLFINENEVTNGDCSVEGSALTQVKVKGRYAGSEEYIDIAATRFTYKASDEEMINNIETSSYFSFRQPGTAELLVTSVADKNISAKVTVTSHYVPVTGVRQSVPERIELHGRDANSEQSKAYIVNRDGIFVEPENASNKTDLTITSSDPEVGAYVKGWVSAYVPYQAGTTTYTATLREIDYNTKEERVVSDSKTVTYYYKNPLTAITMASDSFEVEKGTEQALEMTMTGACSDQGYNLTEPGMEWTYEGDGIVRIFRKKEGYWKRQPEDPDNNMFVQSDAYFISGLKEGTVTVTGTPLDNTNDVEPVRFTVTVKGDAVSDPDIDQLVEQGSDYAKTFIQEKVNDELRYSDEWQVIALLRAGAEIEQEMLDAYYRALVVTVKGWQLTMSPVKPTDIERVALALTLMEKDITDIDGVDLAEMIYNHEALKDGANELAYALLALDARETKIPETAQWDRESMVQELLKFQNSQNGGFGLIDNDNTGIDITAMAVQALAKYQGEAGVDTAIQKALGYLKERMSDQCDFGTAESTAQVLMALAELGINPIASDFGDEYTNIIVRLMDYYCEADGGFVHNIGEAKSDLMAANQALQAFEAYSRYAANEASFWNMTDLSTDVESIETVVAIIDGLPRAEELTLEDKAAVQAARAAYNALSEGQKKNVTNYDVLLAAEERLTELQMGQQAGKVTISIMDGLLEVQKVFGLSARQQTAYRGMMLAAVEVPIYENDSMMSVIERTCVTNGLDITLNQDKTYISAIGGLAEFDRGRGSGWMGTRNDVFVDKGLAHFTVKDGSFRDGDVITMEYTHDLGNDLQENAELKSIYNNVGTLTPQFDRATYQYKWKVDADTKEVTLNPEAYNRYSDVEIKVDGVTYEKQEAIPVVNGMEIVITSSKSVRGEETKTYTIQVEAEQKEAEKPMVTLINKEYGITLAGRSLTSDMKLVVVPLKQGDTDVELMRKEIPSTQAVFRLYQIQLWQNNKKIELTEKAVLSIPVGDKYIREEMTVLHCKDGKVVKRSGNAADTDIQVSVDSLGSFGVVVALEGANDSTAQTPEDNAGGAPKTGDTMPVAAVAVVFVLAGMAAVCMPVYQKRRK